MKWIKRIFIILFVIIVLIGAALAYIAMTFDANQYKSVLVDQVQQRYGRTLTIDGDLALSIYPWLGVKSGSAAISNPVDFNADEHFAKWESVEISLALMPLLKKKTVVKKIKLQGVELNLHQVNDEQNNWQDLIAADAKEPKVENSDTSSKAALNDWQLTLEGFEMTDSKLRYRNDASQQDITVAPFTVNTGSLMIDVIDGKAQVQPVFLDANMGLNLGAGKPEIKTNIKTKFVPDLNSNVFTFEDLIINSLISGQGMPEDGLKVDVSSQVEMDVKSGLLTVSQLKSSVAGVDVTGDIALETKQVPLAIKGKIATNRYSLSGVAGQFGVALPVMQNASALSEMRIETGISGNLDNLSLAPLTLEIDETTVTGDVKIQQLGAGAINFNLSGDQINLDNYMPAPSDAKSVSAKSSASTAPPTFNVNGKLALAKLHAQKLDFTDATLTVIGQQSQLNIKPLTAKAYDGTITFNGGIDMAKPDPAYNANFDFAGIKTGPLLKALFDDPFVSSVGNISGQITSVGSEPNTMLSNLNGDYKVSLTEGTINGSKLARKLTEADNKVRALQGKPAREVESAEDETKFSSLTASGNIVNGILSNKDLNLASTRFQVRGDGQVNLPASTVDYTVKLARQEEADKERTFLPMRVTGPFNDLSYDLKLGDLLKQREEYKAAKQRLEQEKEKAKAELEQRKQAEIDKLKQERDAKKEELEKKRDEKKDELKEDLEKKLDEKLKGLFN